MMEARTGSAGPPLLPPTLPAWAEQVLLVGGRRTRIFQFGHGPPLLLLPSAFLRASSYRPTIERLAAHFRVIAAEMPGSGASQRLERAWGFAEAADWAAALLDALDLRRAVVLGHSDTGGVAAVMAVRHPDRLDALVLADSVGARPGAGWATLLLGRTLDAAIEEPRLNLPLGPHLVANLLRHPRNWLYHAFHLAADTEPLEVAPRITAPTLIAWGRRDHTFPPACAERFQAAIPGSRIAWSEGSHDWLITRPAEFADAVADFTRALGLMPAGSGQHNDPGASGEASGSL
jgi:pimeloyl-ACP methyl ester carboxylesterase